MEELEYVGGYHHDSTRHPITTVPHDLPRKYARNRFCVLPQAAQAASCRQEAPAHLGRTARSSGATGYELRPGPMLMAENRAASRICPRIESDRISLVCHENQRRIGIAGTGIGEAEAGHTQITKADQRRSEVARGILEGKPALLS